MSASGATLADVAAPRWYRSPWPWALMAGPAFVIVGGAYAAWLAATTSDGLVADDYYKRGLAINRTLARSDYAARSGLVADIRIDETGAVRVALTRADGGPALPDAVRLRIAHPTRAGDDREAMLARSSPDGYAGRVELRGAGKRYLTLESDAWRLSGVATLGGTAETRLVARDPAE